MSINRLKQLEKKVNLLEELVMPEEQSIITFRTDKNGNKDYKLLLGKDSVWVDEVMLLQHTSRYKRRGLIFVPEKNQNSFH